MYHGLLTNMENIVFATSASYTSTFIGVGNGSYFTCYSD